LFTQCRFCLRRADQTGAPSPAADPHQGAQQRGHQAQALRISTGSSCAGQIRPAHRDRLRDPHQAAHVGPGRSEAAALASSLPALDPHQDAQQRGHRAHALRILAAKIYQAAAPGRSGRRTVPGCRILSRRRTLAQGEAQRRPLPLPSLRWILPRTRSSEATRPTRCGSSRRRSSRQLRPLLSCPNWTRSARRSKTTLDAQEVEEHRRSVTGCGILSRRRTLAQGEAQRRPLPLPSPRWILTRARSSVATRPRRCGSAPANRRRPYP